MSGCGCGPCATTELALRGDPAARKLLALQGRPLEIEGILPAVVYPSDVKKLKDRIDPSMVSTDAAVDSCAALPIGEKTAWKAFYASWRLFYSTPVPWFFGASNDWDEAEAYQAQLAGWQEQLRTRCNIPGPVVQAENTLDLSGLKFVSVAVIVVAAVYALKTLKS